MAKTTRPLKPVVKRLGDMRLVFTAPDDHDLWKWMNAQAQANYRTLHAQARYMLKQAMEKENGDG